MVIRHLTRAPRKSRLSGRDYYLRLAIAPGLLLFWATLVHVPLLALTFVAAILFWVFLTRKG